MMRKYYYEREDHDEFVRHCNADCSNVECHCVDYDDPDTGAAAWYKTEWPTIDCVVHNIERHNKFPYRCYVDTLDTPPQRTEAMYATLSDDIIAALEVSALTREEVEERLGVTPGTLLRYVENPWAMPLVHLMSLGDILNRRVVINVLPLEG